MRILFKFKALFIVLCILCISVNVNCQNPQVSVNPNPWTLDLTGEITEAGTDFIGTYTSAVDQGDIRVFGGGLNVNTLWTVSVSYQANIDWDTSVGVFVKRTGDGTTNVNNGTITGGNAFQQVGLIDQYFFEGRRRRNNIPIQYQLNNISVTTPAQSYTATIIYTLTTN